MGRRDARDRQAAGRTAKRRTWPVAAIVALLAGVLFAAPAMGAPATPQAAANAFGSLSVKDDGTLWAWGANAQGELGLGDTVPRPVPVQVGSDDDWKDVALGGGWSTGFALALKQDGSLWACGNNLAGQLGTGDGLDRTTFVRVGTDADWAQVSCGEMYTLACKTDGSLYAWGSPQNGELGLGPLVVFNVTTPTRVGSDLWTAVAAGADFAAAVRDDGSLWTWGDNGRGQLGTGGTASTDVPVRVGSAVNWASVSCAQGFALGLHTAAVKTNGQLYSWGANDEGQLGQGDTTDRLTPDRVGTATDWSQVACGAWHTIATRDDGTLWAWGGNGWGQAGPSSVGSHLLSPRQIGSSTAWAAVACGWYHDLAVKTDGTVYAFGSNFYGQVGLGFPNYRNAPSQVGTAAGWTTVSTSSRHAAGIHAGTLWTWGDNGLGQLGLGASGPGSAPSPVQVGTGSDWKAVAAAMMHTLAVKTDGTLWAWGDNDHGQLGIGAGYGETSPVQVTTETDWSAVACAAYHSAALKDDGTLWMWGDNTTGELGRGDTTARTVPEQVGSAQYDAVSCADFDHAPGGSTLAVRSDGTLWAWGDNQWGQLGLGDRNQRTSPVQVGTASDWASVSAGSDTTGIHVLALKTDGTLWAWGMNNGQLGIGPGAFEDQLVPVQVGTATDWAAAVAGGRWGDSYSMAVKTDGTLWACGGNDKGQLGMGDYVWRLDTFARVGTDTGWTRPACGAGTYIVRTDGTLWACGDNSSGQLGVGDPPNFPTPMGFELFDLALDLTPPEVTTETATAAAAAQPPLAVDATSLRWYRRPVTVRFRASDGQSGVSRTEYTVTLGVSWRMARSVTISRNGITPLWFRAKDRAGNGTTIASRYVALDRVRPTPVAASTASVRRGRRAGIAFKVKDIADMPTALVRLVIRTPSGRAVKTMSFRAAMNEPLTRTFVCRLPKGRYRCSWYAKDLAGNLQSRVPVTVLTVK
jgi:alpha-tubulin suppressor-like RCC1 family protein